jgi:hypothetical protein
VRSERASWLGAAMRGGCVGLAGGVDLQARGGRVCWSLGGRRGRAGRGAGAGASGVGLGGSWACPWGQLGGSGAGAVGCWRRWCCIWEGWAGFSRVGPVLAGLNSGFSRFALFQEILLAKFFILGRNLDRKSSILREIRGIGDRKFVEM